MGATIVALCVAMATGGLAARSLHEAQPVLAIALAPALGLGLYALVRLMNVAKASLSVRSMAIVFATGFAMIYYLVLAGETYRPHRSSDPIVRLEQGLTLLLWLFGAAAVPIAIAAIGAWRAGGATRRHVRPGARAPFFVTVGLGAATFSVSMGILVAAMAVLPRAAYVYALLAILFVLPLAFHSVQTYLYGRILSRWEVESIPDPLVRALAELRSRCSFQFDRVICLDAGYSNGRVAAVTSSIRSATLLLSEPLVGLLDRDELLAVLAHETAHVELNHVRRKLIFGVLATAIGITSYTLVSVGLDQHPSSRPASGARSPFGTAPLGRTPCLRPVRHEKTRMRGRRLRRESRGRGRPAARTGEARRQPRLDQDRQPLDDPQHLGDAIAAASEHGCTRRPR